MVAGLYLIPEIVIEAPTRSGADITIAYRASHASFDYNGGAEQAHWSDRGRAMSVANADTLGRPRRSVWSLYLSKSNPQ